MPGRVGNDALEQVAEDGQQRERGTVVHLMRPVPLGVSVPAWYLRSVAEALVP